jgi:EmrB/QacA subfamily drug resistance transporter
LNSTADQPLPRRFIAAIVLGAALTPLNSTMIAVALPAIGETYQVSPGDLTLWLVTSYLLVNIILQTPAGKLGDMLGRRRAFNIGLSLFVVGALVASFAPMLEIVTLSRILMAAGGAMLMPNATALLRNVIPENRRSRAFGYYGALLGASAAIGPLMGGILTQYFGWKAIFLANIPILLLSFYLIKSDTSYESFRAGGQKSGGGFDYIGVFLLALPLGVLVIGLKGEGYWPLAAIMFGAIGLFGFTRWERHASDPLIDLKLFSRVPFVIGGAVTGLHNLGMYALLFQLPFLLKGLYQMEATRIGPVLLTMMIFMVFLSPVGGRLSESLGTRPTTLGGLLVALAGMILLLITTGTTPTVWIFVSLALVGAGLGIVSGPVHSTSLSAVPAEQSGVAASVISTMRYIGGMAGITIISIFLTDTDPADMLSQNRFCFAIYVGVYLLAFVLVLVFPGREKPLLEQSG